MPNIERVREVVLTPPDADYFRRRAEEGWKLIAMEWQREGRGTEPAAIDPPFGFRIGPDCAHLQEDPTEQQALETMMQLIVQDLPLSRVAQELSLRGFRTRQGARWSAVDVFELLPRLVESGPRIFSREDWAARRTARP